MAGKTIHIISDIILLHNHNNNQVLLFVTQANQPQLPMIHLIVMKKVKRLYEQFQPHHYILDISPNRDTMKFSGRVVITGKKVGRPSKRLTLHQKDLKITSAHLIHHGKKGDQEVTVHRTYHHGSFDEIRLHSETLQYPGKYTISLSFEGEITQPMNGMYPCTFTDKGVEKKLIATQFESHHAREVFPCIDEPEAKATFDLTLSSPEGESVIANTPIKTQKSKNGFTNTTFERTPIMSTYLLAFVYGELNYKEAKTKDNVVVRTYATPDKVEHTKFALDVAVKILEFYNDYFGIDYPLEKCDMIALPDFASGAMENWGCITYREHALLVDPDNTSLSSKQYVALVVAHELAHQWFGNLVTMRWWTDLWLNEGFASWIEYLAIDHIFPKWKMWTQFVVDEQQQALKLDALEHTHPIEVAINHPDEIRTIFDAISYSKGASVINMLYHYLGADAFRAGLQYYLRKYSYKNTDTIDLWDSLEEASEKPVKSFMHAWTSLSGYPLVHASIDNDSLELSQERFYLNPLANKKDSISTTWPVALLSGNTQLPDMLESKSLTIDQRDTEHIKLNRGESGFYRTVYNATHLYGLSELVKRGRLSPLDRLGILADIFEASKAGKMDTADALNLLGSFNDEEDNAVWDVIVGNLASIRAVMQDDNLRESMKPYIRKLVKKQQTRLGWNQKAHESHFDKLLRPTIIGMAAVADNKVVINKAKILFDKMEHPEDVPVMLRSSAQRADLRNGAIDPDMRSIVYGTAARHGGEKEFNKLMALHNSTDSSEERLNLCAALCAFRQSTLIDRALAMIDSDKVRLQDVAYWLAYSFGNRHAHIKTWDWVNNHWDWLAKNLGNDLAFYRLPIFVARGSSDANFLKEYKIFFSKHMSPAFERSINQGIEIIQWQSEWKKRDLDTIKAFFRSSKFQ